MTAEQAFAFFVFALVAAITPGPSNVLLTATGLQTGLLRGLPCLFGVSAGMGAMMLLGAYGFGTVVTGHPQAMQLVRWAGAMLLLWLAWKIASAPVGEGDSHADTTPTGFFGAAALQWVNPKAWLVAAGAVATYLPGDAESSLLHAILFALVFVGAALPSGFVWLAFGAAAQRLLRDARRQRGFNIAMGLALAASVVMILH
jgi:threonine/homoserine/homoserine lactone efflux protein